MQELLETEKIIIGRDFNRRVGKGKQGSESINGNWGFGKRILDFAEAYRFNYCEYVFKKKDEHVIIYKSV